MSWMEKLYQTYQQGIKLDLPLEDKLMPVCHTLQNAHIKITISGEGNFRRAEVLEKTQIVLPATESSAGRSSGEAPHPLADKIQYIAQDYASHGGKKKAYFKSYLKQISDWAQSEYTHPKVCAIKAYIEQGNVVADLVAAGILFVDEAGKLRLSWPDETEAPAIFKVLPKEKGMLDQGNALVCWNVEIENSLVSETWKDESLWEAWIQYDLSKGGNKGLCFVTGEQTTLALNHPAKLRHTGDKAKLISSNDLAGFTFKGRFTDNDKSIEETGLQSVGIGFDVTQKAHNALRWLIARQRFRNGDQFVVTWAVSGQPIPDPMLDTWDLSGGLEEETAPSLDLEATLDHTVDLGASFASALNKCMAGYSAKLSELTDDIVMLGLDSATPGRMAITYYQEFRPSQYIDAVRAWHTDFAWYQRHKQDFVGANGKTTSKTIWPISTPSPRAIWEAIYGDTISDSLKKNVVQRLLSCIVERKPFPQDLMLGAVRQATNRNGYKSDQQWLWEQNLGIACALFRGFSKRDLKQRKEYQMSLEEDNCSRDYLYGRLLAIAEKIEEMAMSLSKEPARSTHASRMMQRFSEQPSTTWLAIERGINPYQQRLKAKNSTLEEAYKRLLDDVSDAFDNKEFNANKKLSPEYLLGYHCQRRWLRSHKYHKGQWVLKQDDEDNQTEELTNESN